MSALLIPQSTDEIDLEIDLLPANTPTKLYDFVIRPLKAAQPKRAHTGKGTGTTKVALFEKNATTANNGGANGGAEGDRSSDSRLERFWE